MHNSTQWNYCPCCGQRINTYMGGAGGLGVTTSHSGRGGMRYEDYVASNIEKSKEDDSAREEPPHENRT